jgi:hypothetical protein
MADDRRRWAMFYMLIIVLGLIEWTILDAFHEVPWNRPIMWIILDVLHRGPP